MASPQQCEVGISQQTRASKFKRGLGVAQLKLVRAELKLEPDLPIPVHCPAS